MSWEQSSNQYVNFRLVLILSTYKQTYVDHYKVQIAVRFFEEKMLSRCRTLCSFYMCLFQYHETKTATRTLAKCNLFNSLSLEFYFIMAKTA